MEGLLKFNWKVGIISFSFIVYGCQSSKDLLTLNENNENSNVIKGSIVNRNVDTTLTNNYVVEYDFKTGLTNNNTLRIKVDRPVVFRIVNINRWAYDIKVTSKDSVLALSNSLEELPNTLDQNGSNNSGSKTTEEIPALKINIIKEITSDDISAEYIRDSKNKVPNSTENLVKSFNDALRYQDLLEIIHGLNAKRLVLETEKIYLPSDSVHKNNDAIETLKKDITDLEKELQKLEPGNRAVTKFNKDNKKLMEAFSILQSEYLKIIELYNYNNFFLGVINDPQLLPENFIKKKEQCEKIIAEFPNIKQRLINFQSNYFYFSKVYNEMKHNYELQNILKEGGVLKLFERADEVFVVASKMNNNVDPVKLNKMMSTLDYIYRSLDDVNTFQWVSSPIQPYNDVVIFEIDIKSRDKMGQGLYQERKFRHREFTYGGTRIDFGIGLAASNFNNTPVYELVVEDVSGLSQISIQQKSNSLVVPSFLGLATMSYRSSKYVTYGGSAGLGIDVVNGKIELNNFFIGPSFIFGRFERFTATAGGAIRNVRQLKSGIEEGQAVMGAADDINAFLSDKYKIGGFVSLTYNLTNGAKKNLRQLKSYY